MAQKVVFVVGLLIILIILACAIRETKVDFIIVCILMIAAIIKLILVRR